MNRSIHRLTFVTDAPHFGGAERYVLSMAAAAKRCGMEAHIHWMQFNSADADVFSAKRTQNLSMTRAYSHQIRGLQAILSEHKPDALIINASGRPRFWLVPWLARHARIPAVWVHHMVDSRDHRRLPPRLCGGRMEGLQLWRVPQTLRHRLAAVAATGVIVSNERDRAWISRWHGVSQGKVHVISPGVDVEQYQHRAKAGTALRERWGASGSFVIGTAARLVQGKGIEQLIEAVAALQQRGLPAIAVIAGTGPQRDTFSQFATTRNIAHAVKFIDFQDDMPAFYSALDVCVLCSETESFGLALTEAMACERPVVATPTAGAIRQIDHLQNGWLLKSESTVELTDALGDLYADANLRTDMSRRARCSVVQRFSIDATLESTLRVLNGSNQKRATSPMPDRISLFQSAENAA